MIEVAPTQVTAEALIAGLDRLDAVEEADLVAVPDAMVLAETSAVQRVQRAVLDHCQRVGQRFAILDAPGGAVLAQFLKERDNSELALALPTWRASIAQDDRLASNAALYHPWVQMTASAAGGRPVPPCGHVAGVFARSDARIGVFKPPANEEIFNAVDFESRVDEPLQQQLNPAGINCLRVFPGRGLRVYGARTLSRDPHARYIHVRRLFQALSRWIDRNMTWAAFEPNTPRLWLRIQRELNGYLDGLWQAGALRGASAAEAFYVKCDAETNPAAEREQGRVFTDIGLAVTQPAEFVVLRIVHRPGTST